MELKTFTATDLSGNVLATPKAYLYAPGTTTLVTGLQDASGQALSNPWDGNAFGRIVVAAPNGDYDLKIVHGNRTDTQRVRFIDASSIPAFAQIVGRNRLVNANGLVNQRGYVSGTATTAANQYTIDQWRVVTTGQSLTFVKTSDNATTFTAPAGGVEQVIERESLEAGSYVLSWVGTATATVNGTAVANGGAVTHSGSSNVVIRFTGGTFKHPKFEAGAVATPFELRTLAEELTVCQRYLRVISVAMRADRDRFDGGDGATLRWIYSISQPMRALPSPTLSNVTYGDQASALTVYESTQTRVVLIAQTGNTFNSADSVEATLTLSAEIA